MHESVQDWERTMEELKCVLVGSAAVGKTSLIISYTTKTFPKELVPDVIDTATVNVMVDQMAVSLRVWDTPGNEEGDRIRPAMYPQADVFLLCYSIYDPVSFDHVSERWLPELKQFAPKTVPIFLVGTKEDLRREEGHRHLVTEGDGDAMAESIGAVKHVQCSALTQIGIKQLFDEAIQVAIDNKTTAAEERQCQRSGACAVRTGCTVV
eukprot:m.89709 g.89709  ORF g.89709 m.89709 type:complete len:209 (+) comp20084_c0_seq1:1049-1675(+)